MCSAIPQWITVADLVTLARQLLQRNTFARGKKEEEKSGATSDWLTY
jgi:hypothetical protein